MPFVIIAGSGRGVGKTAVSCALISAFQEFHWVVFKITPHPHHSQPIHEETDPQSEKDTGRYLAAGAARAFLLDGTESLKNLLDEQSTLHSTPRPPAFLFESNQAIEIAEDQRAIRLTVLAGSCSDWKPSVWQTFAGADALVLTSGLTKAKLPVELKQLATFELSSGNWISEELSSFVCARLF